MGRENCQAEETFRDLVQRSKIVLANCFAGILQCIDVRTWERTVEGQEGVKKTGV